MVKKTEELYDLGVNFQLDLFHEIIVDPKFGETVIDILDVNHFKIEAFQKIIFHLKKYYREHDTIMNFPTLETQIEIDAPDLTHRAQILDTLKDIKERTVTNKNVRDYVIKFCKMRSLKNVLQEISKKVERGIVEEYDQIEKKLKDALVFKEVEDSITLFQDMNNVLDDDFRDPIPTGVSGIDEIMNGGLSKGELALVIAPLGVGKAQPLTSKILTPNGWTTMGEINVGDMVISSSGKPTKVIGTFPQEGDREVYTVKFTDRTSAECDIDHLWSVIVGSEKERKVLPLREIMDLIETNSIAVPLTKPIEFEFKEFDTNPYILGLALGNTSTNQSVNQYIPLKSIGEEYLYNTLKVRLELLRGLLDSGGGHFNGFDNIQFKFNSLELAKDVRELVQSLGGVANIQHLNIDKYYYYVNIDTHIFRLLGNVLVNKKPPIKFISEIVYKGKEQTKCIMVDDESHEYITNHYIVTHNTTYLTKVANQAYMDGRNVLQIFFEDKEKAIQRKHYSIISETPLNNLSDSKDLVKVRLDMFKKSMDDSGKKNNLFLQKLPADGVTVTKIKNIIKKLNSQGHKIDLLVLDYIDCISLEKEYNTNSNDEWANEGRVMRLLETVIEEVDVACWTATQGNRASTSLEVVKTENMGGSLKKAQIAHFIMSIGKTLDQKEASVATISILKNRLGKDGMVFPNCKFDNGTLKIDTDDQITEKGFEVEKGRKLADKQKKMYEAILAERNNNSGTTNT